MILRKHRSYIVIKIERARKPAIELLVSPFLQICDSVDISASCLTFVDVDHLSLSTRQQNRSLLEQTFIQMNFKIFSS